MIGGVAWYYFVWSKNADSLERLKLVMAGRAYGGLNTLIAARVAMVTARWVTSITTIVGLLLIVTATQPRFIWEAIGRVRRGGR